MDQAGQLWQEGRLADRVGAAFIASMTAHGGQESTILALNNTLYHWGMVILPLGYTASEVFNAGGNPYGTSFTSGKTVVASDGEALAVARYQGQRLARYAAVIGAAGGRCLPGRSATAGPVPCRGAPMSVGSWEPESSSAQ